MEPTRPVALYDHVIVARGSFDTLGRQISEAMPNPDIEIRPAESGDLAALLELYRHLNPIDQSFPSNRTEPEVWRTMLDQPGFSCIVGMSEGLLIASCCLAIIPNLTRGGRSYALIENVVTHIDYRRRGVGTAVVSHALRIAWQAGCYKVMLLTGSKRPEVHQFYRSCGFRSDDKTGFVARPA
jgi:GNAT superfamily N-acetyltransferase